VPLCSLQSCPLLFVRIPLIYIPPLYQYFLHPWYELNFQNLPSSQFLYYFCGPSASAGSLFTASWGMLFHLEYGVPGPNYQQKWYQALYLSCYWLWLCSSRRINTSASYTHFNQNLHICWAATKKRKSSTHCHFIIEQLIIFQGSLVENENCIRINIASNKLVLTGSNWFVW